MEAIDALLTRRSVRRFTAEPVIEAQVEIMLRAAMHAPSACNQQPWHFLVVEDRDLLDRIRSFHPYAQMLKEARLAVIVCAQVTLETCTGNWVQDCAAAMENLLLAAHAQGLGAVWVGIYPGEERINAVRDLFGLKNDVIPLGLAAVGHPLEPLPKVDRYRAERVHRNRW
jgi:nitroreductase